MKTFESLNPATGEVVGIFPVTTAKEVDEAVLRAQAASDRWSELSFRKRLIILRDWASLLTREINNAADLIHRETGKPHSDAALEAALAIEHISWADRKSTRLNSSHVSESRMPSSA